MKKKILIGSIIAVAILTLVSFSSVVGYNSVKSNPSNIIITDEWDFEYCKDYLFETFVEIADNEDVSDLINSNNQNLFPTNSNYRTFFPFRRNANKLSVEHLDLLYDIGIKLIDILEEDKVAEILETISIDKPDFTDELDKIIMGDSELVERISTLNKMNGEEITDFEDNPIICSIIGVIAGACYLVNLFTEYYFDIFRENNNDILFFLLYLFYSPFMIVGMISMAGFLLLCWDFYPYSN